MTLSGLLFLDHLSYKRERERERERERVVSMAIKILSALDSARLQCYHFKAIVIAGMGLFTDAYDLFCITPVMKLIGRLYYQENKPDSPPGVADPAIVSTVIGIGLLGTVFGQLIFGYLGDRMGRRRIYGVTLALMVFSSIGSGFSICRTRKCVITSLCFFRFLLGIGIGGDYPLSATIMSEFATKIIRGSLMAAVFAMQGFGILVGSAATVIIAALFDIASRPPVYSSDHDKSTPAEADLVWRLILMFGAIPAGFTFYWRMKMPETARYTALVLHNVPQATEDMGRVMSIRMQEIIEEPEDLPEPPESPTYSLFSSTFFRQHGRDLFATSTAWFLVDIVFYSSTLFQSQIYKDRLSDPSKMNCYGEVLQVAAIQAVIAVSSIIPGYWFTVLLIDRIGRVKIQIMGFLCMAVCLITIAKVWHDHTNVGFFVLYGLTFFFSNFGPNATTFIVPAELFPAKFRSTCHGISGAAGKVGAIIGSVGFFWASQSKHQRDIQKGYHKGIGVENSLVILGGVCIVGAILTFLFTPETNGKSLEENESESENEDNGVQLTSQRAIEGSS